MPQSEVLFFDSAFALLASQGIWASKYPDNPKPPKTAPAVWLAAPTSLRVSVFKWRCDKLCLNSFSWPGGPTHSVGKLGRKRPQTVLALFHLKSEMLGCTEGEWGATFTSVPVDSVILPRSGASKCSHFNAHRQLIRCSNQSARAI